MKYMQVLFAGAGLREVVKELDERRFDYIQLNLKSLRTHWLPNSFFDLKALENTVCIKVFVFLLYTFILCEI